MHGVIFTSLQEYLTAAHGGDVASTVSGGREPYRATESYPDHEFTRMVDRASQATGRSVDALVYDFGVFTAITTFVRLYPAFFAVASSARDFLLTVEGRIHELVRATVPNAAPPELGIRQLDDGALSIIYASRRGLCVLLRGLVQGTASHYGEQATVDELACMRQGDAACRFEVRLNPARFS